MSLKKKLLIAVGLVVVVVILAGIAFRIGPFWPIPDGRGLSEVPGFIGAPAVPKPLPPKAVPAHPLLAPMSGGHDDTYNSDVQDWCGPLGNAATGGPWCGSH